MMSYQTQPAAAVTELTQPEPELPAQSERRKIQITTRMTTVTAITETTALKPAEHNLNLADAADLQRVSGIGAALAEAIIADREQRGGFIYRAQLLEISGVGEQLLSRIMDEFEIPDEQPPPAAEVLTEHDEPTEEVIAESPQVYYYNANTVTREELLTLPDMTEQCADAILAMRESLGSYHGIYEIMLAEGISGAYFENVLHEYLYVEGDPNSRKPES